jgi:succinyl-diaminopimelate desuccinylase
MGAPSDLSQTLATRTLDLCRVSSVIGQERAIADMLEQWGRSVFPADAVQRIGHTLVFGRAGMDARPNIGLFGHVDTVPAHPGDPEPSIEGADVVGLGSSDMKSGIAVMQLLAERLDRSGPFNVVYVMYEREEGPYLENGLGPLFAARSDLRQLDFAICLEPSDNTIQMGCCGSLHAQIRFSGRSAHSARPWQGENAVHKAGSLLARLLAMKPNDVVLQGYLFREVFNVTLASGGRARNVIPEAMTLNLNYRFAPNRSLDEAKAEVLRLVGDAASVEFTDLAPAGAVFADNPLLKRLVQHTRAAVESKQAWTDVARLGLQGIPAVNFGPGSSAQAHQAGERVSIAAVVRGFELLLKFLTDAPVPSA